MGFVGTLAGFLIISQPRFPDILTEYGITVLADPVTVFSALLLTMEEA